MVVLPAWLEAQEVEDGRAYLAWREQQLEEMLRKGKGGRAGQVKLRASTIDAVLVGKAISTRTCSGGRLG